MSRTTGIALLFEDWAIEDRYENNQSDDGESLYYLYLDMFGFYATFSNISDPTGWEHFSDDSTYIEWSPIPGIGSEIVSGGSLTYLFSSDKQLGGIYHDLLFEDGSMVNGSSVRITAVASVPEPAIMLLQGIGLLMMAGIKKKIGKFKLISEKF